MSRLPYQVIVIPYRFRDGLEVCVLKRNDFEMYQWVSGGGENTEVPYEAACRELMEETGIKTIDLMSLSSLTYIPSHHFKEVVKNYPNNIVVPEYSFACEVNEEIQISDEHESCEWMNYDDAMEILTWDSNKTALYELKKRLESNKEYWDVYNGLREKTGKVVIRGEYDFLEDEYHLVVVTWIVDSKNRLLMQRRSYDKDLLPGIVATHGGSAVVGETSLVGAMREVYEEIGIAVDMSKMKLMYSQFKEHCLYDTYVVKMDVELEDIKIDSNEVDSCMFVTFEEMERMMSTGECYDYRSGQGVEYLRLLKEEVK